MYNYLDWVNLYVTSILVYDHAFPFQHEAQVPYDYMLSVSVLYIDCIQAIYPWQLHDWWWYFVASSVSHKMTTYPKMYQRKWMSWKIFSTPLPKHMWWQPQCTTLAWKRRQANQPNISGHINSHWPCVQSSNGSLRLPNLAEKVRNWAVV